MKGQGIFVTIKPKNEALAIFKSISDKYRVKNPANDRERILLCKACCHDITVAINKCFSADMWGPKQYIKEIEYYQGNDDINRVGYINIMIARAIADLCEIISGAIPISELPSCKRLSELSIEDATSAIKDLCKNNIINAIACGVLFGKAIADKIEIYDVENFYKRQIKELKRELEEEGREMNPTELFLMTKYRAELGYCYNAHIKTGISGAKELMGLVKNANEAIQKYEALLAAEYAPSIDYKPNQDMHL